MNWPEGPVCDACYAAALQRQGTCARCGQLRRLVAPPGPAAAICGSCSGTGPAGHVCAGCGREDKLYERGYCPRCSLRRRADALLTGPDGTIPPPLICVRDAIAAAGSARGALNWLRRGRRGAGPGSHRPRRACPVPPGLRQLARPAAADYVRALLVAQGALPGRDEALARLERDTAALLGSVTDPEIRRTLTAYATWRVLQRARWNASHQPAPHTATRTARLRLRAAAALLQWLSDRGIPLSGIGQADVDCWLTVRAAVPPRRRQLTSSAGQQPAASRHR